MANLYEECWKKLDHERRVHACSRHKPHNTHCQHQKKKKKEEKRVKEDGKKKKKKDGNVQEGSRDVDWTKKTQLMDLYSI